MLMRTPFHAHVSARRVRDFLAFFSLLSLAFAHLASATPQRAIAFDIPAGTLADSLDRFGEQSGLQVVYDYALIGSRQAHAVVGTLSPGEALDRCLADSGLEWRYVNDDTVVLRRVVHAEAPAPQRTLPAERAVSGGASPAIDLIVIGDPRRALPTQPSTAAFGFDKSLVATPRSVSVVNVATIELLGLSAVEDLVRIVPGVYTTTRWGIQGSVDVRNVPADTYFRGMKRLNLQGHGRSVLAAMETIEIVKGPPSPIYGMGKIGGYTNMVPKSVRAANGEYLPEPQGFVQGISGSYDKSEVSFGVGGPMRLAHQQGGYYIYGLFEDSGSFIDHVPVDQGLLQAAISVDDFAGPFRLETGINLQRSETAGALIGRFTQDVADTGRYIRGTPLVDLDINANGRIGYLEMYERSPVRGETRAGNEALRQSWDWPTTADGTPLALEDFPSVSGIPQVLYDYLNEHPEADPTGLLRAQGPGGPLPASGYIPAGFALDPRSVGYEELDLHRPGAFERELQADFLTAYFDLVNDADPNVTIKNQLFFDSMDQYKISEQPFSQSQDVYVVEDKLTMSRRLSTSRSWLQVQRLVSANFRYTSSKGYTGSGDFGTHRTDAMSGDGGLVANSTFATPLLDSDLNSDGLPWTSHYDTQVWELGTGALFDITVHDNTSIIVGGRIDHSRASNVEYAGTLDMAAGNAAAPAVFQESDERASGRDTGFSWSVSASHKLRHGLRPYFALAEASLALDGNNNKYSNSVIEEGHIGRARLMEVGLKAGLLDDKLFFSTAAYNQARRDVSEDDDNAVIGAHVSATITRGWEAELSWAPSMQLLLSFYALRQETEFSPNLGATIMVDARALGFRDVLDAQGNVIYPAEAFLYGGRSFLELPANMPAYADKEGNPETQLGMTAQYELASGLGFTLSGNYFSSVYAGRLRLVELPEAHVFNAGLFWDMGNWHIKGDVLNVFDERYFRARTGDTLGDPLVSAMPGRRWQLTFRARF